jgi:FkbM family methyltransferase
MSTLTGPLALTARQWGRRLGLNGLLAKLPIWATGERRFSTAIAGCIRAGDNVWDVGANIGSYTLPFSHQVGGSGRVFAFEPSPLNLARLREGTTGKENVVVLPFALSNTNGQLPFSDEPDGTTSRIVSNRTCSAKSVKTVHVRTGDEVISSGDAAFPNIIKIDVEGHEMEVLFGLSKALTDPRLRGVFVEVHFAILHERGMRAVPHRIEQALSADGFCISWTDPSHLQAIRSLP